MSKQKTIFWLQNLVALASGVLLTSAFAPYGLFPAAVVAPAFLLTLILQTQPARAFVLGFLFGLGLFSSGVYWVFISIHYFGDASNSLAFIITLGLIATLSCFPAFTCYFTARYFRIPTPAKILFAFPAIWVFIEWIRSSLFTGFPWLYLGYSQTNSPLKGYAPILGVYGVSLAVVFSSALLVSIGIALKQKQRPAAYRHLFYFLLLWITGAALSFIPWTKPINPSVSVSLVQGNIPQSVKWAPEHINLSLERYQKLTEPLWGKNKVIIWPESAIPLPILDAAEYIEMLDQKALQTKSQLILGVPIETSDKRGYYNAIVTLGKEKKTYIKRRLVPFGEYTPMARWLMPLLNAFNIPTSNLVPGAPVQAPLIINNIPVFASICYEIAFPELMVTHDKTIGYLLTITNDAWFGDSSAKAQHLQMALMRAMEMRRPLLFVSNDGITAIVDANGKINKAAPPNQATVLNGEIQPRYGLTPWMRNGTDPILFILISMLFIAWRLKRQQ